MILTAIQELSQALTKSFLEENDFDHQVSYNMRQEYLVFCDSKKLSHVCPKFINNKLLNMSFSYQVFL